MPCTGTAPRACGEPCWPARSRRTSEGAVGAEAYAAALAELRADRPAWFATRRDGYFALPHSDVSAALVAKRWAWRCGCRWRC